MVYHDNFKQLSKYFPEVLSLVEPYVADPLPGKAVLEDTPSGHPTLYLQHGDRPVYMHSKYNPLNEARSIIQKYQETIEQSEHLVFFGLGLGYHVEEIMKQYPDKMCSIYEPNPYIFVRFLESRPLTNFPVLKVKFLLFKNPVFSLTNFMQSLYTEIGPEFAIITTPAYERLFQEEFDLLYKAQIEALELARMNKWTEIVYRKRWLMNSLKNMKVTARTPNIIRDMKPVFQGKPIIIAAAGPSLIDDLDSLRRIKQDRLAYIFAAGSANKLLLKHGITPDGIVTYDPQPHNVEVFRELIDSGRRDIPLIYGTSVAYETLEQVQGPKFHMVTSVDEVSNFYLNQPGREPDVMDVMTVSLIAIQLAQKLQSSAIILSGLNLSFRDKRYYAEGIEYRGWAGEAREDEEYVDVLAVQDVQGQLIETNRVLNKMRLTIEDYIRQSVTVPVYNTTKGGAAIEGTTYVPLEHLIENILIEPVAEENWHNSNHDFVKGKSHIVLNRVSGIEQELKSVLRHFHQIYLFLEQFSQQKNKKNSKEMNQLYRRLANECNLMFATNVYQIYINPLLKDPHKQLNERIKKASAEKDIVKLVEGVSQAYHEFLLQVQRIFEEIRTILKTDIHPSLRRELSDDWKWIRYSDPRFVYIGDTREQIETFEEILLQNGQKNKYTYHISNILSKAGDQILFGFSGTKIRVRASAHPSYQSKVRIIIDGKPYTFTTREQQMNQSFQPDVGNIVFEISGLANRRHDVRIELGFDGDFAFEGVELDFNGRLYRSDEVDDLDQMTIGQRIRCHYRASENSMGAFSGLGKASGEFIPLESTAEPDGDFYFIMIDEVDGRKILVADRNVQHSISWRTLHEQGAIYGSEQTIDHYRGVIRSLGAGYSFVDDSGNPTYAYTEKGYPSNEWDKYIKFGPLQQPDQYYEDRVWNTTHLYSWCQDKCGEGTYTSTTGRIVQGDPEYRIGKGRTGRNRFIDGWGDFTLRNQDFVADIIGFRPVFEVNGLTSGTRTE